MSDVCSFVWFFVSLFFKGTYNGDHISHYNFTCARDFDNVTVQGFDLHRETSQNKSIQWRYRGQYSTEVFAKEAQKVIKNHQSKQVIVACFVMSTLNILSESSNRIKSNAGGQGRSQNFFKMRRRQRGEEGG